jgi:fused signal recognition particle receptor
MTFKKPSFFKRLISVFTPTKIDASTLEELHDALLMADVGVETSDFLIERLKQKVNRHTAKEPQQLTTLLAEELKDLLSPAEKPLIIGTHAPFVILMVGVNGAGKTTSIGKLAKCFQDEGKSVMLAAGDTFRAAAVEQLQTWGERNNVPVVAQVSGSDSAAVIFDAIQSARAKNIDVLIADTAGRLHTQNNLMDELKKIVRVIKKADDTAPHEILLVLDASIGQNALQQAKEFKKAVNVSGLILTKLDGTAKGGVVLSIAKTLELPIRFIGVGEQKEDLQVFDAQEFVDALLGVEK